MPSPIPAAEPPGSLQRVLQHAWDANAFTTGEAVEGTGLTRSTTIEALDRLVGLGLLHELENAREAGQYRMGRPSRRFGFHAQAAAVVGVDAGRLRLTAAVADLRGQVLTQLSVTASAAEDDPRSRRREIQELVDAVLDDAHLRRADVLSICIGVPAAVGPAGVSPPHRLGFWQAMNPDLQGLFAQWAPLVRVENDASLAAVAEGSVGAAVGSQNFVALLAGERFGIGAVVDGGLLYGEHGAAGESIAVRLLTGIEDSAGLAALIAEWARADVLAHRLPAGHSLVDAAPAELTAPVVLDLAASGDEWARALAARAASALTRIGAFLASLYDPEWIIVSGAPSAGLGSVIAEANRQLPDELHGPPPRIVASPLGEDVVVTGSIMRAVDAARQGALRLALHGD